ncbi:MAG: glycosyltransferase family 1 protein [Clostridiaceae bacterium]|nr:glycosyltransferase family 1 protein [Clostridiaceae bacterium]
MNKTCIFFSIPLFGHVNSSLPLLKRLISEGCTVYYLSDEKFRPMAEYIGAIFIPYSIDLKIYLTADIADSYLKIYSTKLKIDSIMYEEALSATNTLSPDFIIHDSMAGFAKYAAISKKIKAINIITSLAVNPAVFLTTLPVLFPITILMLKHPFQTWKLIAEGRKAKKAYKYKQFQLTDPFVNEEDLNILLSPYCFQPCSRFFNKKFIFARPTINERIVLNDTCQEVDFKNPSVPLIYVSLGTIAENGSIRSGKLNEILNVLARQKANILISLGNLENVEIRDSDNIKAVRFVNQLEVLKKASLFINHGGLNSIYEAIWFKVPQICIPSQVEQLTASKILEKKHCGICIGKFNATKLEKAITLLLDKEGKFSKKVELSLDKLSNSIKNSPDIGEILLRITDYLEKT